MSAQAFDLILLTAMISLAALACLLTLMYLIGTTLNRRAYEIIAILDDLRDMSVARSVDGFADLTNNANPADQAPDCDAAPIAPPGAIKARGNTNARGAE